MVNTVIADADEVPYSETNRLPVDAIIEVGDISIGAIEIKDADTNIRANVIVNGDGDHRLLVDAGVTSVNPNDVVTASTHNNVDTVKASYTVPIGKILFITSVWASTTQANIISQLQSGDTPIVDIPVSSGANSFASLVLPTETPYGPFVAGVVIEIERIEGLSGLPWSAGFVGYVEDI